MLRPATSRWSRWVTSPKVLDEERLAAEAELLHKTGGHPLLALHEIRRVCRDESLSDAEVRFIIEFVANVHLK